MLAKIIVIATMLIILFALGSSLFFLVNDEEKSHRMVKALTWRISISLILFIFLFVAFSLGWIQPHAI